VTSIVAVGLVAVGLLFIVRAEPQQEPFDPRSSSPSGTRGLVVLLEDRGATVDIARDAPEPGADERVIVFADLLDDDQRGGLLAFVEAGGVAVVADPDSALHGGPGVGGGSVEVGGRPPTRRAQLSATEEANVARGDCSIGALQQLRGVFTPDGVLFPTDPTDSRCFVEDGSSFVITRSIGDGIVVGLGDNESFTNEYLRYADNAGLATSLLAPFGEGRVRVMLGRDANRAAADIGTGDETLVDLVRPGWWMAMIQLGVAFVVLAFARGVRVGRPVREPIVAPIAGNELVAATGNLMQRAKHAQRAGWLLRARLHRDLCAQFGVDPAARLDELDRRVSERAGTSPGAVAAVLIDDAGDDAGLLRLSHGIDRIRKDTT
jgi:hypothetical protein